MKRSFRSLGTLSSLTVLAAAALAACSEIISSSISESPGRPQRQLMMLECTASVVAKSVSCLAPSVPERAKATIIGGQNTNVKLTSSNVAVNADTIAFDVTVQNLLNESIGTPDGTVPDPDGIRVFLHSGPVATGGTGTIDVANADGVGTFTGAGQRYFAYYEILAKNQVSTARRWKLRFDPGVTTFAFQVMLETDVQYLLVINEVMVNPPPTLDTDQEWFELYNAGSFSVDLENLVIADSAASGRRPYHVITGSLVVEPGGYVVLGNSTNTTANGGASVDYAYGTALQLANSLDAVKIARVYGTDTLTIDRAQYSNPSVSAQSGITRELKNPSLDNSNMDGSNWDNALVTSVYGPGGRGTPKAQNSSFAPDLIPADPGGTLGPGAGIRAGPIRR